MGMLINVLFLSVQEKIVMDYYMQQNASKYGILRMGIFGSVARNEHTATSDVDIYIEGQLDGFLLWQVLSKSWKTY